MSTYQTIGLILKKTDHAEADQLFSIYTQNYGKVIALGRGTKKIQSKLNSSLKMFGLIDLMIAPGKNYSHIAGAVLVTNFPRLGMDLKKIVLGSFALELVDKLTETDQPDSNIFNLLAKYLSVVNDNLFKDKEWRVVKQAFIIKLLSLLGLAPNASIAADPKKLNQFLKNQLEAELQTEKFLVKMKI
ncbi:MAG: DNA repair protein RecO [Patescibacteria group bacterium]|jgi:DNA repair protein RecO (recombination protein O)